LPSQAKAAESPKEKFCDQASAGPNSWKKSTLDGSPGDRTRFMTIFKQAHGFQGNLSLHNHAPMNLPSFSLTLCALATNFRHFGRNGIVNTAVHPMPESLRCAHCSAQSRSAVPGGPQGTCTHKCPKQTYQAIATNATAGATDRLVQPWRHLMVDRHTVHVEHAGSVSNNDVRGKCAGNQGCREFVTVPEIVGGSDQVKRPRTFSCLQE